MYKGRKVKILQLCTISRAWNPAKDNQALQVISTYVPTAHLI
ncbi:hypothetical protein [Clostridium sp.]